MSHSAETADLFSEAFILSLRTSRSAGGQEFGGRDLVLNWVSEQLRFDHEAR